MLRCPAEYSFSRTEWRGEAHRRPQATDTTLSAFASRRQPGGLQSDHGPPTCIGQIVNRRIPEESLTRKRKSFRPRRPSCSSLIRGRICFLPHISAKMKTAIKDLSGHTKRSQPRETTPEELRHAVVVATIVRRVRLPSWRELGWARTGRSESNNNKRRLES
jgi:hypothetical protein